MPYFNYDITKADSEYYEALEFMMDNWESEIVEFKEAKGHYDTNKVGQYFSAISNEANLANRQYGWFILGVSEKDKRHKDRYFPLPDYNLDNKKEVSVVVYGKILDPQYTYYLYEHPELSIDLAFLLDMVQKNKKIPTEARKYLRDQGLIEGRGNNIFLAADVSRYVQEEAQYIKNKGFTDKKYKEFILEYLRKYHKANRKKIDELLLDVLPRRLSDEQKHTKINTLLTSLRRKGLIKRDSSNQQSGNWILANEEQVE